MSGLRLWRRRQAAASLTPPRCRLDAASACSSLGCGCSQHTQQRPQLRYRRRTRFARCDSDVSRLFRCDRSIHHTARASAASTLGLRSFATTPVQRVAPSSLSNVRSRIDERTATVASASSCGVSNAAELRLSRRVAGVRLFATYAATVSVGTSDVQCALNVSVDVMKLNSAVPCRFLPPYHVSVSASNNPLALRRQQRSPLSSFSVPHHIR